MKFLGTVIALTVLVLLAFGGRYLFRAAKGVKEREQQREKLQERADLLQSAGVYDGRELPGAPLLGGCRLEGEGALSVRWLGVGRLYLVPTGEGRLKLAYRGTPPETTSDSVLVAEKFRVIWRDSQPILLLDHHYCLVWSDDPAHQPGQRYEGTYEFIERALAEWQAKTQQERKKPASKRN